MNICVYGAASNKIDQIYIDKCYLLGAELAKRNITLVFGSGAGGVMGACARGAFSENGTIIGVVPRFFDVDGVRFDKCTETIFTKDMRERKQTMEDKSDAFIVAPGGIGTFDEFFEIFTLQSLERHKKPIVIFNVNGYYDSMLENLSSAVKAGFISEAAMNRLLVTDDIDEIFEMIDNFKY